MNERVKQLRKELNLSGEKFGARLGVKRSAISDIERGRNNITEQMILSICREFGVNEQWLRTGEGNMFLTGDDISIDELITSQNVDKLELEILQAYFSIDKDVRREMLKQFKSFLSR